MAAAHRTADTHDEVHTSGLASKAEIFGCANNSEFFSLVADQHRVSAGIFAEQAAESHAADTGEKPVASGTSAGHAADSRATDTGTEPVGDWASTCAYVAMVNKAAKDLAGKKTAVASKIVPPCGADHEKSDSDSEFESCRGSDPEESDSAADGDRLHLPRRPRYHGHR